MLIRKENGKDDKILKNERELHKNMDILRELCDRGFKLGEILKKSLDMPLRKYLKKLISQEPCSKTIHFQYVQEAISRYFFKNPLPDINIDEVCRHLELCPVIQQADHSNLLLDEETFLNNYLFYIASKESGIKKMIISQCSTVSCLSRRNPVAGPVFLRTRGEVYKIFSFSKKTLKDSNFCALPKPVVFDIKVQDGKGEELKTDKLLGSLIGRQFESATSCFHICNYEIWNYIIKEAGVERIAVDESMTSEIAALHIKNSSSPINRLLFDPSVRDCFLKIKREFVSSSKNLVINRASPDFLWFRNNTKLYSVILIGRGKNASFYIEEKNRLLPVPYTPQDIAQALLDGQLYVDKIITYLARCLLPGIVAVGGTSQQDYVSHCQYMLLKCHAITPFLDDDDFLRVRSSNLSRLGGAPLLELNTSQTEMIAQLGEKTPFEDFNDSFLDLPIKETIGKLNCARYLIERGSVF